MGMRESVLGVLESGEQDRLSALFRAATAGGAGTSLKRGPALLTFDIDRVSHGAAVAWSALSPAAQNGVLDHLRAALPDADEAAVIGAAFDVALGLAVLPLGMAQLNRRSREILENQKRTLEVLDRIEGKLDALSRQVQEARLVQARAALDHLEAGVRARSKKVRAQQLGLASHAFSELANLDPQGSTQGTSTDVDNLDLVLLGRFGNHLYFHASGEHRQALVEVYQTLADHPLEGAALFGSSYLDKDHLARIVSARTARESALASLRARQADNSRVKAANTTREVGGAILGLLAAGAAAVVHPVAGAMVGVATYNAITDGNPAEADTKDLEKSVARESGRIERATAAIVGHARRQLALLEAMGDEDLAAMGRLERP